MLKIDGCLARNIDFDVANFRVLRKTRRKTSILKLQSVKIGGSLARNARFGAPTCLVSRVWFSRGLAVSMGEAAKLLLLSWFLKPVVNWRKSACEMRAVRAFHVSTLHMSRVADFPVAVAVSMGEAAKPHLFECFHAGCHVVLRFQPV